MDSGIDMFDHPKKSLLIMNSHFHPVPDQLFGTASFGLVRILDLAKVPSPLAI
jgi:hypothetical protein